MQSNQNSRGKDLPAPTGCSSLILMDANMRDSLTYSLLRRCLQCVSLVSKFSCNNIVGTFNWITYTLLPRSFCRFPQELYQLLLLQFHHPTPPYSCLSLSDRKRNDFQVSGAAREMDLSNLSAAGNQELIIIYRSIELMFRITSRKMLPVAIFLIYSNQKRKKEEEEGSKEHFGHFSFLL